MKFLKRISKSDWTNIFNVSTAIAFSALVISGVQFYSELQNRRHALLADYFDDMTQLQLGNDLVGHLSKQPAADPKAVVNNEAARELARAKTLITLSQLEGDGHRKGQLLKFLAEADLINKQCQPKPKADGYSICSPEPPIFSLKDAKLSGVSFDPPIPLKGVDLNSAFLTNANLQKVDLGNATLIGADLTGANLSGSYMVEAQMQGADLNKVKLQETDLRGANLKEAKNLQEADLRGAKYDDLTTFPEGFDKEKAGMKHCSIGIQAKCE